jgi:hypothetical protein
MTPHGHTSSLTTSVGAPWEIYRLGLPVSPGSNRTRISDLYTKAGGQAGYGSIFALSPDHGLGFSVNVAGATAGSARWELRNAITESFILAAEHEAAVNAAQNYAGTYTSPTSPTTNITLKVSADKPGLSLDTFFVEGVDWRANVSAPFGIAEIPSKNLSIHLYPNGIVAPNGDVGFYGVPEVTPRGERSALEGGAGLFDRGCETWMSLGFFSFLGVWPESFIINVVDGRATSIFSPGGNITLLRTEE